MRGDVSGRSSRLSGFYKRSVAERAAIVAAWAALSDDEIATLGDALSVAEADKLVENVVGRYTMPLGIGTNFQINDRDYLIPMVIEEPSVVAAVSFAAKLVREGGGFRTGSTKPIMIGQIQLLDVASLEQAGHAILAAKTEILMQANTSPTIAKLGGGPLDLELRSFRDTPVGPMLVVHLLFDTRDAMGANAVNTAAETVAPVLEKLSGGRALLRILSNYSDRRRAWAEASIPVSLFGANASDGESIASGIVEANGLAQVDVYRATTHNKGIFNGIDAVAVATGNDWRAIEAGAHAYAARSGQYRSLTEWQTEMELDETGSEKAESNKCTFLRGRLELPLAVGIVGGATRAHPVAQVCLKILGVSSAQELAEVMVAVGLAQNLAALRALVAEGIQQGHMALHARQVAVAAGAQGEQIEQIAGQMVREGQIRVERARALLGLVG